MHVSAQAHLTRGSVEVAVSCSPGPDGRWVCTFIAPSEPGLWVLEVMGLEGRHLRGSPLSVQVGGGWKQSIAAEAATRAAGGTGTIA